MSGPSTASDADFEVATVGELSIEKSVGPSTAPHHITARTVQSDGSVEIGVNTFSLFGDFSETLNGALRLSLGKNFKGNLDVNGNVDLAGHLIVKGNPDLAAGDYSLIKATAVSGTFTRTRFLNIPASLAAQVKYTATEVILTLKSKG